MRSPPLNGISRLTATVMFSKWLCSAILQIANPHSGLIARGTRRLLLSDFHNRFDWSSYDIRSGLVPQAWLLDASPLD